MSKFWFRKNHASDSPARSAENQNLVSRQETFDRARDATIHLLTALKQWPGFDSTGTIDGAIDHTLVTIDRLDDALDELRELVDKFRAPTMADIIRNSGHPSVSTSSLPISEEEAKWLERTAPIGGIVTIPRSQLLPKPGQQLPTPKDILFTNRKPAVGDQK